MKSVSGIISLINDNLVLSMCLSGKCSSKSLKIKIPSSFFNNSARCGPTPFKYSIGFANMLATA